VLVSEANRVTDEELFALRSRRRCRFDVRLTSRRFRDHDKARKVQLSNLIGECPTAPTTLVKAGSVRAPLLAAHRARREDQRQ
jgi:hypothetical protein